MAEGRVGELERDTHPRRALARDPSSGVSDHVLAQLTDSISERWLVSAGADKALVVWEWR